MQQSRICCGEANNHNLEGCKKKKRKRKYGRIFLRSFSCLELHGRSYRSNHRVQW